MPKKEPTYAELQAQLSALKKINSHMSNQVNTLEKKNKNLEKDNIELEKDNKHLQDTLNWYQEQLKTSKAKIFGASSEHMEYEQINLFNEAEAERTAMLPEPDLDEVIVKSHPRKKKRTREELMETLPVETVEYTLPEDEQDCPKCGEKLHVMGKEVRKELKIIPAQVKVVEHVTYTYSCRSCEKIEDSTPVITAPTLKSLIPKSFVSPSLMAYIMNQKFTNHMPLYRQEQEFKRFGVMLSRQTLSNWVIKGAAMLKPLYEHMHNILVHEDVLHADETTLEVLNEPGRPATSKSYMWLYRTSKFTQTPIVLYNYKIGRSGKYAEDFLKSFNGYLNCDGWSGYHRLLEHDVILCGCYSHLRRKFFEAYKLLKNPKSDSIEAIGVAYCDKLFAFEKKMAERNRTPEQIYRRRQRFSKPFAEAFLAWAESEYNKLILVKSKLGEALKYAVNQKQYLLSFLEDGRIELSNNRAENSIRPFVISRKNWLFCNTPGGADSSAIVFSIIETAKENNLKPFHYLEYIFENIQRNQLLNPNDFMPWSNSIPDTIRMKDKDENDKQ